MKILITSRHIEISSKLKTQIEEKIQKVLKNIKDEVINVNVSITAEKSRQSVEIKVTTNYTTFRCVEETHDLSLSLDKVIDVLEGQIRKNKEKFQDKRRKPRQDDYATQPIVDLPDTTSDISDSEIISSNKFATKPMSIDEALMQLKLSEDQFIVFVNAISNEINVLYKRKDGKFGLIEPEF
jgi:putative sigma-54 modulation protein